MWRVVCLEHISLCSSVLPEARIGWDDPCLRNLVS